eukprot:m.1487198 g.1487198  ORF g.1487198 m.1487198 type:complete len:520 (-) comp25185_c1_seq7:5793-7352(-)
MGNSELYCVIACTVLFLTTLSFLAFHGSEPRVSTAETVVLYHSTVGRRNDHKNETAHGKSAISSAGRTSLFVSIMSASNGQYWCNQNLLMNACYQAYKHSQMELLISETSRIPSTNLLALNGSRIPACGIQVTYWWYNSTAPLRSERNPVLGLKREIMATAARGSIVIVMDNDDVYHPSYVNAVVDEFNRENRAEEHGHPAIVFVKQHAFARVNPDGTIQITRDKDHPHPEKQDSAVGANPPDSVPRTAPPTHPAIGAHAMSFSQAYHAQCRWDDFIAAEETAFIRCRRPRLNRSGGVPFHFRHLDVESPLMLIKFVSGMSITRFVWNLDLDTEYSRLRAADWQHLITALYQHYAVLHELSRPAGITRLPSHVDDRLGGGNRAATIGTEDVEIAPKGWERQWGTFYKEHPGFFQPSAVEDAAECHGFMRHPGQSYALSSHDKKMHHRAKTVRDCCAQCRTAKVQRNNTCTVFEYDRVDKSCTLYVTQDAPGSRPKLPRQCVTSIPFRMSGARTVHVVRM